MRGHRLRPRLVSIVCPAEEAWYGTDTNDTDRVLSFNGEVVAPETMEDPEKRKHFDLMAFVGRNSKEIRWPEIEGVAKELKSKHSKVGAIGYCYGGWAVFQLGGKGKDLVDCVSAAHPSLTTKEELANLAVPTQILSPETDQMYTPELKTYSNEVIPTLGIDYDYQYFPGVVHGFAVRGDPSDSTQKQALERAKNVSVNFFNQYLH